MELNYENLVSVLTFASKSERSLEQQNAESQLKSWEIVPGYHYLLQEVYLNTDLPLQIRWLAIICFKMVLIGIGRVHEIIPFKTRKTTNNCKSMDLINEKNNQLMLQNAYSISKLPDLIS